METCKRIIKKYSLIPEIIFCSLTFYLVWMKCGLWFETNDDLIINDLLRGAITGQPEYHTIYNSVILTAPLSLLYRIAPTIPWWGGFLILCNGMSIIIPLDAVVKRGKNFFSIILGSITIALTIITSLYLRGRIQYTSTAMLLAIAGFVALALYESLAGMWLFGICQFLAFLIRPEAMEIVLPVGFGLLFVCLSETEDDVAKGLKKIAISVGVVFAILLIGYATKFLVYSGSKWEASKTYESGRQQMFDYTGIADYDDIKENYKRGVTKGEYEAFGHSLVLDYEHLAETVQAASYISKENVEKPSIPETLRNVYFDSYFGINGQFKKLGYTLLGGWILLLTVSIICRRIHGFIGFTIIYLITKGVSWGYIFMKGRMPIRIMLPMYILELTSLAVMAFLFINDEPGRKGWLKYLALPFIAALGFACFISAKEQFLITADQMKSYPILREMETEISNYCKIHGDKKLILSTYIYSNFRRSVFDVGEDNPEYIYAGGWFSCLPSVKEKNHSYLESGYIYLITTAESINGNVEAELDYLNERYDYRPQKEDVLSLVTGGEAIVYRVR